MQSIIFLVIGIFVGYTVSKIMIRDRVTGTLRVDRSDPDSGPYLFLELSQHGAESIQKKKYVILKVDLKDFVSHK